MAELGLQPGELDLLYGGPPCQPFSQIGKRQSLDDDRGLLLFEMVRFAEVFRPRVVLTEQVRGLLSATDELNRRGGVFKLLIERLEASGYVSKWQLINAQLINAADYGVPQLRQRIFIVNIFRFKHLSISSTNAQSIDKSELSLLSTTLCNCG